MTISITILMFSVLGSFFLDAMSSEVIHIRVSENSRCTENSCTLPSFAEYSFSRDYANWPLIDTTLIFEPGNHSLESEVIIDGGINFTMVSNDSSTTIVCAESGYFHLRRIKHVYISGLIITGCGSHEVHFVKQFSLVNCVISSHVYTALHFQKSKNVYITNTSFISNWGGIVTTGAAVIISKSNATFERCVFVDSRTEVGAAIFSTTQSNVTVIHSTFVENQANGSNSYGGVLYFGNKSNGTLYNSTFQGNSARDQGGVIGLTEGSSIYAYFCTFMYNTASDGAVIRSVKGDKIAISNCTFVENTATGSGGVLYVRNIGDAVYISGSTFESNQAHSIGGVGCAFISYIEISSCIFMNNTALEYGGVLVISYGDISANDVIMTMNFAGYGGAIYTYNSGLSHFVNCEFSHNSALVRGGVFISYEAYITFVECVFSANRAFSGAVLHIQTKSEVKIMNVTLRNNTASQGICYFIESTAIFFANVHVVDNFGSLFSHYSKFQFSESVNATFVNNEPSRDIGTSKSRFQEGGAITAFQSEIDLNGNVSFAFNTAVIGGAICLIASKISVHGNVLVTNNTAADLGGGIYLYQSEINCKELVQ